MDMGPGLASRFSHPEYWANDTEDNEMSRPCSRWWWHPAVTCGGSGSIPTKWFLLKNGGCPPAYWFSTAAPSPVHFPSPVLLLPIYFFQNILFCFFFLQPRVVTNTVIFAYPKAGVGVLVNVHWMSEWMMKSHKPSTYLIDGWTKGGSRTRMSMFKELWKVRGG